MANKIYIDTSSLDSVYKDVRDFMKAYHCDEIMCRECNFAFGYEGGRECLHYVNHENQLQWLLDNAEHWERKDEEA